jgi:hypothetical protein
VERVGKLTNAVLMLWVCGLLLAKGRQIILQAPICKSTLFEWPSTPREH